LLFVTVQLHAARSSSAFVVFEKPTAKYLTDSYKKSRRQNILSADKSVSVNRTSRYTKNVALTLKLTVFAFCCISWFRSKYFV